MDIKEIVVRKQQLEKEILETINKFVDETSLVVDRIDIQHFYEYQKKQHVGPTVRVNVKLP